MKLTIYKLERLAGCISIAIVFPDGTVIVHWNTDYASTSIYKSFEDFNTLQIVNVFDKLKTISSQEIEV